MGKLVYQLGIFLLKTFLHTHALFNQKSKLSVQGRKNLFSELETTLNGNKRPLVWFHCASLGEFEQGRPLIEAFKANFPEYFILLTFFSPSGYEVKKSYEHADYISYMPLDSSGNAKRFVKIAEPKMAFFIKYEFWYFHLKALSAINCWIFSVSAIFRSEQVFFKPYGKFYRSLLKEIDHFFVQNESSEALLKGLHIYNVSITGDTRFDRVNEIVQTIQPNQKFLKFADGHQLLIGGSTWEPDIKAIAPFLQQHENWKAIIAPHDISEQNLKIHESQLKIKTIRLSKIPNEIPADVKVILIDNIGMLSQLYQYGTVAFIGGAFGAGLHNTLEAACFGLPIFFGNKNYQKFQEARQLLKIGAAHTVSEGNDFNLQLESQLQEKKLSLMSEKARIFVNANLGATDKIIQHVTPLVHQIEKS
ncbi:3-deoxy-D-manno-octulosonic acid transferase [Marivirga sp. S37H4]|uniref:3-deoxy-D-manno-octulosonic acid transferase n=1 Tax=Marivirga aurantiaca TaxID=2802615 RepID=A0A935C4T8_9BACT|nr:glycosyltransferase N-terminal domain-containing protein [Marivirga aurantiaca]MBK6263486.1 3-deoxy-D-manno-octulosonic acid transferase [Marivirga aurantiaca]